MGDVSFLRVNLHQRRPNKPLKLTAAGFCHADGFG